MSDIMVIVLDLDGTLLGSVKSISPRNYHAVKRCFEYNYYSGRNRDLERVPFPSCAVN
jgi:hydroxymethylpyrimidine pyrophosphatase-like HAD family hydrolase